MSLESVVQLRHQLHREPELSGAERRTAEIIDDFFSDLGVDATIRGLAGAGLAFVFQGAEAGATLMFRCELDALPIDETIHLPHGSGTPGVAHKCGHDGHMAILAAVGTALAKQRPSRGRVVLLFQPAEETGAGAAAVLADPRFRDLRPERLFALHNLPGFPLDQVVLRQGTFNCASRGMVAQLFGRSAHAAQPHTGLSPADAMCRWIQWLGRLESESAGNDWVAATVVGARLGEKAFGTAPSAAEVFATLRTETDRAMDNLMQGAEQQLTELAEGQGLRLSVRYEDVFLAGNNHPAAVAEVRRAAGGHDLLEIEQPFRWSEDFGRFAGLCPVALFGLGAGRDTADLHDPAYDFPDALIESGSGIFLRLIQQHLGS